MLGWLTRIWNWRGTLGWVVAAAIAIGAWAWLAVKESRVEALRREIAEKDAALEEAARAAEANAAAVVRLQGEHARAVAALRRQHEARVRTLQRASRVKEEIYREPTASDPIPRALWPLLDDGVR